VGGYFRATVTSGGEYSERATREVQEYLDGLPVTALGWQRDRVAELKGENHDAVAAELWRKVEEWSAAVAQDFSDRNGSVSVQITPRERN
jgi:hypothetical protein